MTYAGKLVIVTGRSEGIRVFTEANSGGVLAREAADHILCGGAELGSGRETRKD